MNRKAFINKGLLTSVGVVLVPTMGFSKESLIQNEKTNPLDKEMVYQFVAKAHGDFNTVKAMLNKTPELLNATHDWGNGDFETALGAASHIGHNSIVKFLISKGARFNMFTAAMLGDFVIIKQLLASYPELINAKGPHGLDLIHHAKVGGEQSKLVLEFLQDFKNLDKKVLPPRKDTVKPKNSYEKRAVAIVDFIHNQNGISIEQFVNLNFHPEYIKQSGKAFFNNVFNKCIEDIPPASVIFLDGKNSDGSYKMKLQKTDKSTHYYFRFKFSDVSPHLITQMAAGGSSRVFD
ncbi:ankyrin repeat domain-containing protein [Ichthyenterobacterium magnum]|uniref:Uncharacterized protein n=1 Tax=Ichthyenterobacterium magnum TaxID=1230530 RepID=A0A420DEM4_9FLAO|nr:hypothetical protein [Ichthyenterobacterium magnum]RKE90801.1 hypothetical protein BXY80_2644 [Ichthyenterobacterium magnum]